MKKENSNKQIVVIGKIGNTEYQNNDCRRNTTNKGIEKMEKELKLTGIIDKDGFEIDNRVYSRGGVTLL